MTTSVLSRPTACEPTLELFPTSSLGLPPARTSAAPTPRAKASTAKGRGSSSKPSASSERSALVGSLLRTALTSELAAQTGFSVSWRASTTPAGRSWSVVKTSAPITSASGPGSSDATSRSLPTPRASDASHGPEISKAMSTGQTGVSLVTSLAMGLMSTPRASDMKAGGHGDTGRMGTVRHMLATPRATDGDRGGRGDVLSQLRGYPSKHAGMPGATMCLTPTAKGNPTSPSMMKWAGARALAALLQSHGLTGTAALPITYGWMMGYPPGWLSRALRSAVLAGRLQHPSSSKPSATPSSPRSRKRSAERS